MLTERSIISCLHSRRLSLFVYCGPFLKNQRSIVSVFWVHFMSKHSCVTSFFLQLIVGSLCLNVRPYIFKGYRIHYSTAVLNLFPEKMKIFFSYAYLTFLYLKPFFQLVHLYKKSSKPNGCVVNYILHVFTFTYCFTDTT